MKYEEIKRAVELLKAEREGRLIELPCKLGDRIQFYWGRKLVTGFVEDIFLDTRVVGIWSAETGKVTLNFDSFKRSVTIIREKAAEAI